MTDSAGREFRKEEGELGRILKRDLFLFLLDLEVKRARRYQNFLSILILKLVQSSDSNNGEALRACHKMLTDMLAEEMRETDILAVLSEDKVVALLPYADALAGDFAKSRFEKIMNFYDFRSNGYEVMIRQICFPRNGTSTIDLVKKGLEDDVS